MVSGQILFVQILQHSTKKRLFVILHLKLIVKIPINIGAGMIKILICHKKVIDLNFNFRNDDLYKATTVKSTTTIASVVPLIDRGFYNRTRHSYLNGGQSQQNNNSPTTAAPLQSNTHDNPNKSALSPNGAKNNNRPIGNNDEINQRPLRPLRRPPLYRRRPVDYYYYDDEYTDDFYDERMRRRNRPRNRRPVYDDYDSRRL